MHPRSDYNATLRIEQGAQVIGTATADNLGWVHIGVLNGTRGSATVTGAGSTWTIGSTLQVGGHTSQDATASCRAAMERC